MDSIVVNQLTASTHKWWVQFLGGQVLYIRSRQSNRAPKYAAMFIYIKSDHVIIRIQQGEFDYAPVWIYTHHGTS